MLVTPVYLIFFGMEHAVRVEAESLWTTIVVILWCEAHAATHHPIVSATCSHCHRQRRIDLAACTPCALAQSIRAGCCVQSYI